MRTPLALLRFTAKALGNALGAGVVGDFAIDVLPAVVKDIWDWWGQGRSLDQLQAEVETLAQASIELVRGQAAGVVREVIGDKPAEVQQAVEGYLSQVPGSIRDALRRPADPTGSTVPPDLVPTTAHELLQFLPQRLPFEPKTLHLEKDAEPIRGYCLLRKLGEGGFGEVWSVRAPGGGSVAFKFVRLGKEKRELSALKLLHCIRHPHLLDVQFSEKINGWLVIAMPLCDRSLADRFTECNKEGQSGIPAEELVRYMTEAAEALDFLNEPVHDLGKGKPVGVQHRDVKPANLLLVGRGVRVADFGLAKVLEATLASHSGAMTWAYAAPEMFQSVITATSDQYSLAATYFHLRTGRKLFSGDYYEVMSGHMQREPDLSGLAERERLALARALAKAPERRWSSCQEFVRQLSPIPAAPRLRAETEGSGPAGDPRDLPIMDSPQRAREEQERFAGRLGTTTSWINGLGVRFRLIPPGRFYLGAGPEDAAAQSDERPRRQVRMERPLWVAAFPLTNAVVRQFLESASPADGEEVERLLRDQGFAARCRRGEAGDGAPAVEMSARDATVLLSWMARQDSRGYRLPTEAEWEYFARAGSTGAYWWAKGPPPQHYAIFAANGPGPADERRANAWGLIDTLGNVEELTGSAYAPLDSGEAVRLVDVSGIERLVPRGGSWREKRTERLRVSRRQAIGSDVRTNYVGVRVVCPAGPEGPIVPTTEELLRGS